MTEVVSLFGFQGAGVRKHISGEIKSKDQRGKDSRVRGKKAIEAYSLFSKESRAFSSVGRATDS